VRFEVGNGFADFGSWLIGIEVYGRPKDGNWQSFSKCWFKTRYILIFGAPLLTLMNARMYH
jgi:hypothetical protein